MMGGGVITISFGISYTVLKAGHISGSAFCNFYMLGVPEQALGGDFPLGFGIVVEDNKPSELLSFHIPPVSM